MQYNISHAFCQTCRLWKQRQVAFPFYMFYLSLSSFSSPHYPISLSFSFVLLGIEIMIVYRISVYLTVFDPIICSVFTGDLENKDSSAKVTRIWLTSSPCTAAHFTLLTHSHFQFSCVSVCLCVCESVCLCVSAFSSQCGKAALRSISLNYFLMSAPALFGQRSWPGLIW